MNRKEENKLMARVVGAVLVDAVWLIRSIWQTPNDSDSRAGLVKRATNLIENSVNLMDETRERAFPED